MVGPSGTVSVEDDHDLAIAGPAHHAKSTTLSVVTAVRKTARDILQALDHQFYLTTRVGRARFVVPYGVLPESPNASNIPGTLVLCQDKGCPGYAINWYLMYACSLMLVTLRNIFRREWDDVTNAIKTSGMWFAVLLASVVYNVHYGPWDGGNVVP